LKKKTEEDIIKDHYIKIGKKGGQAKSDKKTLSCRENAKKPRKKKEPEKEYTFKQLLNMMDGKNE